MPPFKKWWNKNDMVVRKDGYTESRNHRRFEGGGKCPSLAFFLLVPSIPAVFPAF
jgi:hypothetical protein